MRAFCFWQFPADLGRFWADPGRSDRFVAFIWSAGGGHVLQSSVQMSVLKASKHIYIYTHVYIYESINILGPRVSRAKPGAAVALRTRGVRFSSLSHRRLLYLSFFFQQLIFLIYKVSYFRSPPDLQFQKFWRCCKLNKYLLVFFGRFSQLIEFSVSAVAFGWFFGVCRSNFCFKAVRRGPERPKLMCKNNLN